MVMERFGRDEHEILIRQLFHIKQTDSVSDYVEKFCGFVDQLASYESKTDPLYYTMKFIDGLQDEIKSSVLVQRPSDLDTACVLARLQEEVAEQGKRKLLGQFKPDYSAPKPVFRFPLPLPPPPKNVDKGVSFSVAEDRRGTDAA